MSKIRYLLILVDKVPFQGSDWLKSEVLDRLCPEEPGKPFRHYIDSETRIEVLEVGERDLTESFISITFPLKFQMLWGEITDTDSFFDKLQYQRFAGTIGKGAVVYSTYHQEMR